MKELIKYRQELDQILVQLDSVENSLTEVENKKLDIKFNFSINEAYRYMMELECEREDSSLRDERENTLSRYHEVLGEAKRHIANNHELYSDELLARLSEHTQSKWIKFELKQSRNQIMKDEAICEDTMRSIILVDEYFLKQAKNARELFLYRPFQKAKGSNVLLGGKDALDYLMGLNASGHAFVCTFNTDFLQQSCTDAGVQHVENIQEKNCMELNTNTELNAVFDSVCVGLINNPPTNTLVKE